MCYHVGFLLDRNVIHGVIMCFFKQPGDVIMKKEDDKFKTGVSFTPASLKNLEELSEITGEKNRSANIRNALSYYLAHVKNEQKKGVRS